MNLTAHEFCWEPRTELLRTIGIETDPLQIPCQCRIHVVLTLQPGPNAGSQGSPKVIRADLTSEQEKVDRII